MKFVLKIVKIVILKYKETQEKYLDLSDGTTEHDETNSLQK
jgi:hypothetical protein